MKKLLLVMLVALLALGVMTSCGGDDDSGFVTGTETFGRIQGVWTDVNMGGVGAVSSEMASWFSLTPNETVVFNAGARGTVAMATEFVRGTRLRHDLDTADQINNALGQGAGITVSQWFTNMSNQFWNQAAALDTLIGEGTRGFNGGMGAGALTIGQAMNPDTITTDQQNRWKNNLAGVSSQVQAEELLDCEMVFFEYISGEEIGRIRFFFIRGATMSRDSILIYDTVETFRATNLNMPQLGLYTRDGGLRPNTAPVRGGR